VALISDFQYSAPTKQFSGYWTMLLSGSETPGLWILEARIDGESAGQLSFQLVAGANATPTPAPAPVPQPLPTSELYKKMAAATVYVDKMDAQGKAVARGSGFYLDDGRLVTAFQNIDGATKLRVISPNGTSQEVSGVLAWNRWQDWVVLATIGAKVAGLSRAVPKSWNVGSVGYILESTSGSGRIIADGTIVGENTYPRAGDRLNIASRTGRAAVGSPLINEFAQVVGMVGGSLAPGTDMLDSYALAATPSSFGPTIVSQDGLALPIDLIPATTGQESPTSLEELASHGQFLKFLTGQDKVLFGELALTLETTKVNRGIASPADPRVQFSHADQKMYVFINWNIREKFKGFTAMAIYDGDNKAIGQSPARKLDLRPGEIASNTWDVPVASMPVGIYRVDVTLGDDIVWRKFFRVVE
jgi:S1-C subfamily serine protease